MFAVSRRYKFDPAHSKQIDTEIAEFFVPMIQASPGFVAYYWINDGKGVGESITVFETEMGAEASVKLAAMWSRIHKIINVQGVPEVMQGEVKAHAMGKTVRPTAAGAPA